MNLRKSRNRADYETRESLVHRDLVKALKLAEAIINNVNSIASKIELNILIKSFQDPENRA
jgi:hypothetical protein